MYHLKLSVLDMMILSRARAGSQRMARLGRSSKGSPKQAVETLRTHMPPGECDCSCCCFNCVGTLHASADSSCAGHDAAVPKAVGTLWGVHFKGSTLLQAPTTPQSLEQQRGSSTDQQRRWHDGLRAMWAQLRPKRTQRNPTTAGRALGCA